MYNNVIKLIITITVYNFSIVETRTTRRYPTRLTT